MEMSKIFGMNPLFRFYITIPHKTWEIFGGGLRKLHKI